MAALILCSCVIAESDSAQQARCAGTGCPIEDSDEQPTSEPLDPASSEALPVMLELLRDGRHDEVRCNTIYQFVNLARTVKAIECCTGDTIEEALTGVDSEANAVFAPFYCCARRPNTSLILCGLGIQSNQL